MKTPILFKKSQMLTHKSTDIGVYTVKNDSPPLKKKHNRIQTNVFV